MHWISFISGLSLAVLGIVLWVWIQKRREYQWLEQANNAKDIIYYVELFPRPRFKYMHQQAMQEAANCNFVGGIFNQIHPEDAVAFVAKMTGESESAQPAMYRLINKEQQFVWFEEFVSRIYKNGKWVAIRGVIRDVSEKMELQQQLEYRIAHDKMTGIYSREYFDLQCEKYNESDNVSVAIIVCDMDNLKIINDTYGHKTGDLYIVEAAKLLNSYATEDVLVCRIGGDEFAVLMIKTELSQVQSVVEIIQQAIFQYRFERTDMQMDVSIGFAFRMQSIGQMEQLFEEADRKMYIAKNMKKLKGI